MALQKQNINISFSEGLDTKTDPNQVIPGKLVSLQNVIFDVGMEFNKRNGYQLLGATTAGVNISTYKNELVAFDGNNLNSYSPSNQTVINKGAITSVDLATNSVFRSINAQTKQDSAYNSAGLYLYVWVDSVNGPQYQVVSAATGNQVLPATSLVATATLVKAWSLGNYLVITYVDTATNHLRYVAINVSTLSVGSPVDISTTVNASNRFYEATILNGNLYIAYNGSDGGGAIRVTYLDKFLNAQATTIYAGENANVGISVFADVSTAGGQVWVAYCNGSQIKYVILGTGLSTFLSPTLIVSGGATVINLIGFASNGLGTIYYQLQNTYTYSSVRSDYISYSQALNTGIVGSSFLFLRGVAIVSKNFRYNGHNYFLVNYAGSLQPTYFLINEQAVVVAKLAYSNAGGYPSPGFLTNVNPVTTTQFQFAYLFKDLLTTQSGVVYTQTGVNNATVDFGANDLYETVELGNNLNINGGYLWAYDGYKPVEQNFHLFPEDYLITASTASTGIISGNTYGYTALYEWTDNQGNIFTSGYAASTGISFTNATSAITVQIPTLRLTQKQNVSVTLYRTAPSIATGIYYKVSSITSPTFSSTAIDSVTITDTFTDAQIVGNELLYTTGGVVQDTGGPAFSAMTLYKNRLMGVAAEDRNTLWYSKQTLEATPVEMSDLFTLFIDPRFGTMTALSVMDDKLIIFKNNAIFYLVGEGPDNTGANNDFTEAVFITSAVGCTNFRSIVLTPDGLMFQTNKGIWLLDRGLGVSWIGAPVSGVLDGNSITSAVLVPNTTQVRFTLSNGIALVYDYFYKQWGTFTNHNAAGACVFNSLFTYLSPSGLILQETPGLYTDNGEPIFMSLTTSWLSLSGFQGYQRVDSIALKGQFLTPHVLYVSIAYDYNPNQTQTSTIAPTDLVNNNYGNDPYYGSTQYYGGNDETEQYLVNLMRQKCQTVQITIQEALDTTNAVYGAGVVLEAIGMIIKTKLSYPKLPPYKSVP
jgi:hypothetical protein